MNLITPPVRTIKDVIKDEIIHCAKDPSYFLTKFVYIQHPTKGKILFDVYPFQKTTLEKFRENRFNIILKSRQLGISTLTAAYALCLMLFHNDKEILVIATKEFIH